MGTRITGGSVEKVYTAAEAWVQRALRTDDSLFTPGKPIWSSRWLGEVRERFLDRPDESSARFLEKLAVQLADSPPEVYQLMGEALYFHFLIVSTKTSANEQRVIDTVLNWSPLPVEIPIDLVAALTPGIAGPGQQFHTSRPFQVGFLIEFVEQWKEQGTDEQHHLLADPWKFKDFVVHLNFRSALLQDRPNTPSTQRQALLHLVHPDTFEAIVNADHKAKIGRTFAHLVTELTEDVDRKLEQIRPVLEAKHGPSDYSFYKPEIEDQWRKGLPPPPPPDDDPSETDDQTQTEPDLKALADAVYLPVGFLQEIKTLLKDKRQVIFQGPPGTGKTYVAQALAKHLAGSRERVTLVQFHPSYAYEDFVQGFRPARTEGNGQVKFELRDGPLLRASERARDEPGVEHFLVIDEINRGNIAKVFGELYFLLEYRDSEMHLQYSDKPFSLPENLYVIGTMNTADRSIALVDLALRRRFYFVEFHPDDEPVKSVLRKWLTTKAPGMEWVAGVVEQANDRLKDDLHAAIGPSYFMKEDLDEAAVERIWKHSVLPYIEERRFGGGERAEDFSLDEMRRADSSSSPPEDGGEQAESGQEDHADGEE